MKPEETNVAQLALGCVAFIILAIALLTINTKLNRKDVKMNVATALTDPRVRSGQMYFQAKDPGAHDPNQKALFRLHTDPTQSLLGAGAWTTLQKLIIDKSRENLPYWWAVGGTASIDWLPEEAELVERTPEGP